MAEGLYLPEKVPPHRLDAKRSGKLDQTTRIVTVFQKSSGWNHRRGHLVPPSYSSRVIPEHRAHTGLYPGGF